MEKYGVVVIGIKSINGPANEFFCQVVWNVLFSSEQAALGLGCSILDEHCPSLEGWEIRQAFSIAVSKRTQVEKGKRVFIACCVAMKRQTDDYKIKTSHQTYCVLSPDIETARGYIYQQLMEDCPQEQGWLNHAVSVCEVPLEDIPDD